jgi:hypothetical protein
MISGDVMSSGEMDFEPGCTERGLADEAVEGTVIPD